MDRYQNNLDQYLAKKKQQELIASAFAPVKVPSRNSNVWAGGTGEQGYDPQANLVEARMAEAQSTWENVKSQLQELQNKYGLQATNNFYLQHIKPNFEQKYGMQLPNAMKGMEAPLTASLQPLAPNQDPHNLLTNNTALVDTFKKNIMQNNTPSFGILGENGYSPYQTYSQQPSLANYLNSKGYY